MKIYLVCQTWSNTKNNHAGILYLCNQLAAINPDIQVIAMPEFKSIGRFFLYHIWHLYYAFYLYLSTKDGDCVILMEYLLSKSLDQSLIASFLKRTKPNVRIIALLHLVSKLIKKHFSEKEIVDRISKVDSVWVLGSSLKTFLCSLGVPNDKIRVIFHYVDTEYYKGEVCKVPNFRLRVVVMGNMQRDYDLLFEVISALPLIDFDVCAGVSKATENLTSLKNVTLHSYMSEDTLRGIMNKADVSLNIMKDTIGSNVIVTSMAMGLAMVVSDVGSIRDYVDESNGLFCLTSKDFIIALSRLEADRDMVKRMQLKSVSKAQGMNVSEFYRWFRTMVYES